MSLWFELNFAEHTHTHRHTHVWRILLQTTKGPMEKRETGPERGSEVGGTTRKDPATLDGRRNGKELSSGSYIYLYLYNSIYTCPYARVCVLLGLRQHFPLMSQLFIFFFFEGFYFLGTFASKLCCLHTRAFIWECVRVSWQKGVLWQLVVCQRHAKGQGLKVKTSARSAEETKNKSNHPEPEINNAKRTCFLFGPIPKLVILAITVH